MDGGFAVQFFYENQAGERALLRSRPLGLDEARELFLRYVREGRQPRMVMVDSSGRELIGLDELGERERLGPRPASSGVVARLRCLKGAA